ncbi:MAG: 1-deoxy-D-xylulose-5-phosphate reductoisomerase [Candidatus Rokuibacteriota bacterium]|jgi:1-deoxy-D-xylulose-5-phosphate reductoisomerase|nr:MAG: 1-deoxy-D-xylulose-5-phosphate reductoisomerase [Candidatus Rokubacteria bacterium]PYO22718.1 MAG: 1-deoxy-D-xylulose-5-phosphate reductoisomerase [Candidatus Rokubacteria bacterium]
MKRITLLGATGSIGLRTLDLVSGFPEEFSVAGMAARGSNPDKIADLCRKYAPQAVALLEPAAVDALARLLPAPRPELLSGIEGLVALARDVDADVVLSALVGGVGLLPTMAAIQAGRTMALANKETLVMAGRLMTAAARARGVSLLPVDSEHSAVFQCLVGHNRGDVHRVLLTASGGPFRELPTEKFATVTVEDALRHPTWKMGAKITIDSATLMNKGLEVIEARWLFDLAPDQVQVVIHPQSIVHSMVEYIDGSVLAQLGVADMGIPILYALTFPERRPTPAARLDLTRTGPLTFEAPDPERFPALRLARAALEQGGAAPVVLNAANEIAVAAFLERRIGFPEITQSIERALAAEPAGELGSIEECVEVDARARRRVREWIAARSGGRS